MYKRKLETNNPNVGIYVMDDPEFNANHEYKITPKMGLNLFIIKFQKGPIQEFGINGCQNEDLLEVIIDRLKSFQSGEFACRENALALTKCEEALHWLNHRTRDRQRRNVEGKNIK